MAALNSCTKETTYTFTDNMDYSGITISRLTILSEYDTNGFCVANNSIESPITGQNYMFIANEKSELVKIYIKWGSSYRWVQQVYYLKKGKNTDIVIDGETIVGPAEP
jgi:hypothetical protein